MAFPQNVLLRDSSNALPDWSKNRIYHNDTVFRPYESSCDSIKLNALQNFYRILHRCMAVLHYEFFHDFSNAVIVKIAFRTHYSGMVFLRYGYGNDFLSKQLLQMLDRKCCIWSFSRRYEGVCETIAKNNDWKNL